MHSSSLSFLQQGLGLALPSRYWNCRCAPQYPASLLAILRVLWFCSSFACIVLSVKCLSTSLHRPVLIFRSQLKFGAGHEILLLVIHIPIPRIVDVDPDAGERLTVLDLGRPSNLQAIQLAVGMNLKITCGASEFFLLHCNIFNKPGDRIRVHKCVYMHVCMCVCIRTCAYARVHAHTLRDHTH